jgi:hypothetical protein
MSSTITNYSNDIDIAFPLPGVDNDSQGFRTNFEKIKLALATASDEITALQLSNQSLIAEIDAIKQELGI